MTHREAHLNLVDSSRRLFQLDPGAEVEAPAGWLFGAGRSSHPMISNAAFRADDEVDAGELIERARSFFGARGRGFALWTRTGVEEDRDLIAAAEAAGLRLAYEMPEMLLRRDAEQRPSPRGAELRRVATGDGARDFWTVATAAYASIGFPPEVFAYYEGHEGLTGPDAASFVAYLDDEPVAIAMTLVSHGVAGIYWVGSTERARGRGLGWAVTAAAVDAGLELGGELASLQASPMGEPLYRGMGFETIYGYRLYAAR